MNEKMLRSVEFWQSFGSLFPASVVIIKKTGDIVYANEVFRNLVGLNLNNLFHFMDKECLDRIKEAFLLCEKEKIITLNTMRIKKSLDKTIYFISYLFFLDNDLFALMLTDNTDVNNELRMLNDIINTVPDPIFVKDEQHHFLCVNQAFAESLGHPISYVVGKEDADFFPQSDSEIYLKIDRRTFKSQKTTINEEKFTTIRGSRDISTKKSVFKTLTGSKILVGIIRDVTEIKEARECLKKHAKELKRQVDTRTKQLEMKKKDLENAVEKLKNLNSDLDCFAHICCHELREPLRTISSFSKLALDEYSAGQNDNIDDFLHIVHKGAARMDKLIKSILEYSTNGLSTSSMVLFSTNDVISEVLDMLDQTIKEKKVIVEFDNMPFIYADRLQIVQLFQNLINNAIKFSLSEKPSVINICATQKNKFVEFQVKDNGIGIAKKYHKEIFLPFKRFHSRSEGSMYGIGLSLCKKIIENHGGSISMSSQENVGTNFKFLLPTELIS
jgi:PAS domain S-box-containing protein